jgi:LCP family protein required for cell wall assembly
MRFLLLGVDEGFKRSRPGYADTIILASISARMHSAVMMSIPRDLWIPISDGEENRIAVAYTIAETNRAGKGADTLTALVSKTFQIPVHYYALVRMQGFIDIVDSLGGVDVVLAEPVARCPAGLSHLDGKAALAFARDREETDDFARMFQAQILIRAILARTSTAKVWSKLPRAINVLRRAVQSNIPFWGWLSFAPLILWVYSGGIENYAITRDMVYPRITPQGEQVIAPDWDKIRALTGTIFGK